MEKLGISCDPNGDKLQERLGSNEVANLFEEEEPSLEEVKEAFEIFDENSDGFIDAKELKKVICTLGFMVVSDVECERMIRVFDDNGDGKIDFNEFVRLVENSLC
ncbi:hypothetical protein L1049_028377 [Liquidambar formosana]|uniref:EF-hand domain-containing protein n=1 Tax=Liquidambar formosana TaxID=63359 RepID=A0AAP0WWF8_LIQFO